MSQLKKIMESYYKQVEELQLKCKHLSKDIVIRTDSSVVGRGSLYPRIDVVCINCGKKRIIFDISPRVKINKSIEFQGFKDERFGSISYLRELDKNEV